MPGQTGFRTWASRRSWIIPIGWTIERKAVDGLASVAWAQLLSYLKAAKLTLGLLIIRTR